MTKTYKAREVEDLPNIAYDILSDYSHSRIFAFYGPMGAGKTTLIKEMCDVLGVEDETSSPTYSLVNEYEGFQHLVYHFDFYRLTSEEQAFDIGYEEYLYSGGYCFIEWPERIANLLPRNYVSITISEEQTERIIKVKPC